MRGDLQLKIQINMTPRRVLKAWHPEAKTNASAGRPAATEKNKNLDFQASAGRLAAEGSGTVNVDSVWPNNFPISVGHVPHLEKVYSNLQQKLGRKSGDDLNDLETNSLIWRMFMTATLDTAVHLGKDYLENLHFTKNQPQRTIRQLFDVTKKWITDQTEIQGSSKIDWHTHSWQMANLLTDKAVQLSTAKVCVFSDSVLCLGKMHQHPESIGAWKNKIDGFMNSRQYKEMHRIDKEPMELGWTFFPGFTSLQILAGVQK